MVPRAAHRCLHRSIAPHAFPGVGACRAHQSLVPGTCSAIPAFGTISMVLVGCRGPQSFCDAVGAAYFRLQFFGGRPPRRLLSSFAAGRGAKSQPVPNNEVLSGQQHTTVVSTSLVAGEPWEGSAPDWYCSPATSVPQSSPTFTGSSTHELAPTPRMGERGRRLYHVPVPLPGHHRAAHAHTRRSPVAGPFVHTPLAIPPTIGGGAGDGSQHPVLGCPSANSLLRPNGQVPRGRRAGGRERFNHWARVRPGPIIALKVQDQGRGGTDARTITSGAGGCQAIIAAHASTAAARPVVFSAQAPSHSRGATQSHGGRRLRATILASPPGWCAPIPVCAPFYKRAPTRERLTRARSAPNLPLGPTSIDGAERVAHFVTFTVGPSPRICCAPCKHCGGPAIFSLRGGGTIHFPNQPHDPLGGAAIIACFPRAERSSPTVRSILQASARPGSTPEFRGAGYLQGTSARHTRTEATRFRPGSPRHRPTAPAMEAKRGRPGHAVRLGGGPSLKCAPWYNRPPPCPLSRGTL
jgi:hypothetical protein